MAGSGRNTQVGERLANVEGKLDYVVTEIAGLRADLATIMERTTRLDERIPAQKKAATFNAGLSTVIATVVSLLYQIFQKGHL